MNHIFKAKSSKPKMIVDIYETNEGKLFLRMFFLKSNLPITANKLVSHFPNFMNQSNIPASLKQRIMLQAVAEEI